MFHADAILSDPSKWDRADDRVCEPTDTTWSLYCAIERATTEVLGEYRHEDRDRRAALREIRRAVVELSAGRELEHRLMDFNNLPSTRFEDVKAAIRIARERVQAELSAGVP